MTFHIELVVWNRCNNRCFFIFQINISFLIFLFLFLIVHRTVYNRINQYVKDPHTRSFVLNLRLIAGLAICLTPFCVVTRSVFCEAWKQEQRRKPMRQWRLNRIRSSLLLLFIIEIFILERIVRFVRFVLYLSTRKSYSPFGGAKPVAAGSDSLYSAPDP